MLTCDRAWAAVLLATAGLPNSDNHCTSETGGSPPSVESRVGCGITTRDVVEQDDDCGTFFIAAVFFIHGCGDPAHAGLDPCDQQGKVLRNHLAALDVYEKKRRVGQIGMDILRPLRLGAMPLLVR